MEAPPGGGASTPRFAGMLQGGLTTYVTGDGSASNPEREITTRQLRTLQGPSQALVFAVALISHIEHVQDNGGGLKANPCGSPGQHGPRYTSLPPSR